MTTKTFWKDKYTLNDEGKKIMEDLENLLAPFAKNLLNQGYLPVEIRELFMSTAFSVAAIEIALHPSTTIENSEE